MIKVLTIVNLLSFILLFSCKDDKKLNNKLSYYSSSEPLIRLNQHLVEENIKTVDSLIKANNWKMKPIGAGIWLEILKNGQGKIPIIDQSVTYNYKTFLLDGTLCYTSDSLGARTIRLGKAEIERGLDFAIQKLNIGSKAQLICLPHVAFGVAGDQKKVPPMAVVRYEIEILDAK